MTQEMEQAPSTKNELVEFNTLLDEVARRKKYNKLQYIFPETGEYRRELYSHALKFLEAGKKYRERCFIAGNRVGKSFTAASEMAYHLTGKYPSWWKGRTFTGPIRAWASGITNETTKEIIQDILFGPFNDVGSGLIPKEDIIKTVNRSNSPETIQTAYVKHYDSTGVYDGDSVITLKSYDQGADKFQGTSQHIIWLDEEPKDSKIWDECLMRTMKTSTHPGGIMMLTFTPLFGLSKVVLNFLPGGRFPVNHVNTDNDSWVIQVTWDDVPHLTEAEKAEMLKKVPPWLRDARTKGIPQIGAGAIYPVSETDILVAPFEIPEYWQKVYAMDVGWHKTAVIWFAQDPSDKVWYAYSEHYQGRDEPAIHAEAIRSRGMWIPGVVDPASNRSRDDGSRLLTQYIDLGLNLTMADNAVEAGLSKIWQMLSSGQLKIFSTLVNWFIEYRCYHKDENGKIPDGQADHLMDATRYFGNTGMYIAMSEPGLEDDEEESHRYLSRRLKGANSVTGY